MSVVVDTAVGGWLDDCECACLTVAGSHPPVLTSRPHIQAVRLLVRRRPREDCPEEPDAHRRAVDGRLEGLLLRLDLELANEANKFRRPGHGIAGASPGAQEEAQMLRFRLVHAQRRTGDTDATARRDVLRRGDEPEDGGMSLRDGRRIHRHHLHVLLPPSVAREPLLNRHPSAAGASRPLRQGRAVHLPGEAGAMHPGRRDLDVVG